MGSLVCRFILLPFNKVWVTLQPCFQDFDSPVGSSGQSASICFAPASVGSMRPRPNGGHGHLGNSSKNPNVLLGLCVMHPRSVLVPRNQILGPKYHPLKPGAWTHASPLGDAWTSPDPAHADPNATAAVAAGEEPPASSKRHFTRRARKDDTAVKKGGMGDGSGDNAGTSDSGGGGGSSREAAGGNVALFMMMGAALQPVARVPAGNVLALAGLEGRVNKCATLSDTPECPAMRAVTLQAKPMVRVAVEALHQQDMDKLELGLSRLYQADPAVEVSSYVVSAVGGHLLSRPVTAFVFFVVGQYVLVVLVG